MFSLKIQSISSGSRQYCTGRLLDLISRLSTGELWKTQVPTFNAVLRNYNCKLELVFIVDSQISLLFFNLVLSCAWYNILCGFMSAPYVVQERCSSRFIRDLYSILNCFAWVFHLFLLATVCIRYLCLSLHINSSLCQIFYGKFELHQFRQVLTYILFRHSFSKVFFYSRL